MGARASEEITAYEIQVTELLLAESQENLWSSCDLSFGPGVYCPFPIQVLHFDSWKNDLQEFETNYNCIEETTLESVSGNTEGIFIDEDTAHFETFLSISCVSNTLNQEALNCYSVIGADMVRTN